MILVNNVIQPCLVCTGPVANPDAFICDECWADFRKVDSKPEQDANELVDEVILEMLEENKHTISMDSEKSCVHIDKE